MDAVEFFEEHGRMCNSFGGDCKKEYWLAAEKEEKS